MKLLFSGNTVAVLISIVSLLGVSGINAALIAHYDFTDGDVTDNEVGSSYGLTNQGGVTLNADGSAHFGGDESNPTYLEAIGLGVAAVPEFTLSFWFKTTQFNQGRYQGIFSTTPAVSESGSWQFEAYNSQLRVNKSNGALSTTSVGMLTDTWYHVVIQKKIGSPKTSVYLAQEGGVLQQVMSDDRDIGPLGMFRLGTNRNTSKFFSMELANVKIYDDSGVDLAVLHNEGVQLVPEPSSSVLCLIAGGLVLIRRKK